jgi:tRNA dimethylallyltransferase
VVRDVTEARGAPTPLVIAGPTGVGKSGLALDVAERATGTIVCADSRQVYETMVIGTAAPDAQERRRVPHVGFCEVPPEAVYDAGRFVAETDARCARLAADGRLPLLVGGTGMYLRSWRYGLDDVPEADPTVRAQLEAELDEVGPERLHRRLAGIDPETAARVAPTDPVRIVRALELFEMTGEKASDLRRSHQDAAPRVDATWVLLDAPLDWIEPRLHRRAEQMLADGLVDEALALRDRLGAEHRLVKTMGYEEALALHDGELPREAALTRIVKRQRRYAKRQRTWFKKEPWWRRIDVLAAGDLRPLADELVAAADRS